jgi:hypothetical protein
MADAGGAHSLIEEIWFEHLQDWKDEFGLDAVVRALVTLGVTTWIDSHSGTIDSEQRRKFIDAVVAILDFQIDDYRNRITRPERLNG